MASLGLLLLLIGLYLVWKMTMGIVGLLVALLVAAVIGFVAEALVPGERMPGGWLAAIGAGLVGSWAGNLLLGQFGPVVAGFALIPAILGAMLVVVLVTLLSRRGAR